MLDVDGHRPGQARLPALLPEEIRSTMRVELDRLVQRAIAGTQEATMCTIDFLRARARADIDAIIAHLRDETPQPPKPRICQAIPESVDMQLDPNRTYKIDLYGHDLERSTVQLWMVRNSGKRQEISRHLYLSTPYHGVINLGQSGVPDQHDIRMLVVRLSGGSATEIPFIVPKPPPPEEQALPLRGLTWNPPHVRDRPHDQGDKDFYGHGPCIKARAQLRQSGEQLRARLFMDAWECKPDWSDRKDFTRAMGWQGWRTVHSGVPGKRLVRILSPVSSQRPKYRDDSKDDDTHRMPSGDLVKSYLTVGDTKDDEAGKETRVTVEFNPARVLVQGGAAAYTSPAAFEARKTAVRAAALRQLTSPGR